MEARLLADDSEPKATSQDSQSQTNDPQDEGSRPAGDGGSGKGVAAQEKEHEPEENQVATNFDVDARDLAVARYTHLKVLHDFVKDELSDVLDLRSKIANSTLENIHFEDLWHLFKPGDVIYSTENGHDQLYKVYFITGGQSLKRSRTTDEITEINNLRDKLRYWTPPPPGGKDEDDEETIEKMLREEGSGIGTWTPFKVDCYMMAFDGERCGPVDVCKKIRAYQGERAITSLPMYPLRFHPKKDELLQTMLERGRKFLFAGGHKSYDGRTLSRTKDESQVEIQSDVYIDFDAFYQDFPHKKPTLGRILRSRQNLAEVQEFSAPDSTRYRSLSGHELDAKLSDDFLTMNRLTLEKFKPEEDQISDDVLCLMPHYVVGYAFQLRKWFHLDIDLVKDINRESASARAAGFDDLVISKRYRDLLVALVDSHASGLQRGKEKIKHPNPMPTQIDLVRGKGQGLIILLHGPPGSGKTSTAETIAAYTRRPLYSITCGDIGTAPDIVEKNLLEHTRRADKWGCVLLLDEADVFLYYAGILFLTTNRPGVIDEAFKSRVHISLRYPGVDLESTKKQWSNILNRLEADNKSAEVKVVFDKEALLDFAQRHFDRCEREGVTWNGRQIRNAFQTALALGHYERLAKIREAGMTPEEAMATGKKKWRTVKLTKANFANIAKTAREFEQYIETLRGSDSVNARESELRYDEWDPDQPRARKQYPVAGSAKDAVHQLHANVGASRAHAGKGKKAARVEHPPSEEEEEESAESDDLSEDDDED
ncbi:hypothetical protein K458DRAFT_440781 [Lentithecium fluviatile CBS 122367]|uniref:AAA+ ATPase domain-containing protein n=1 Tax=Lentithecium fluviatile CBS 122367 TaxID=1168545 RepID=A0A6G1JBW4_9PLEO|nr:hypothetical protein K458DRAFT_440781 [Lentithecium fluviatile CBS 122367]